MRMHTVSVLDSSLSQLSIDKQDIQLKSYLHPIIHTQKQTSHEITLIISLF